MCVSEWKLSLIKQETGWQFPDLHKRPSVNDQVILAHHHEDQSYHPFYSMTIELPLVTAWLRCTDHGAPWP